MAVSAEAGSKGRQIEELHDVTVGRGKGWRGE